jgi:prepilin-type N-terminal cleavage/methylation domain-containing protein
MIRPEMVPRERRGVTLVELLMALVIAGLVGGAMVKVMLADARASRDREAWRSARAVSRGSVNRLLSDLRMVEAEGAVTAASADGQTITLRVPYAMGILCNATAPVTVRLLPVDQPTWDGASFSGFAWRDTLSGAYVYVSSGAAISAGSAATCTANSVAAVPSSGGAASRVVQLAGTLGGTPAIGTPVLLFESVDYRFDASALVAGRTGLWRRTALLDEELAAPFEATSRFSYYVGNATAPQDAVPASLASIRGLELLLHGQGDVSGGVSKTMTLTTAAFFKNRRD